MSEVDHVKTILGVREKVIEKCWDYLYRHFDNLSSANQIKVALAISTKNIPQKIEGANPTQVVIMGDIKKADGTPVRYDIGNRLPSEALTDPGEAVSGN